MTDQEYGLHAAHWHALRWLVRHFQGESIKGVLAQFALIEQKAPWEDDPGDVEVALRMCVDVLNVWGPGTAAYAHTDVDLRAMRRRRVPKWGGPHMGDLYQQCRDLGAIDIITPEVYGEVRDMDNYDVQQRWLTEWRQHKVSKAEARQADLEEVVEDLIAEVTGGDW